MHADRRARRVPALGEQLRVDEHVDLAALVGGEDARELALGRLARDGLRLHARVLERLRDVVRVLDAGRVDDARQVLEAHAVEVGDRGVERALVEQGGQLFLVEVLVDLALAQRHLGDRAHAHAGRDPHAAQRRDHAAARGLREVEARRLGREEVGDVAGDQRAGGGHADEDRAEPLADRGARLLAERGVGLVADDDRVGVGDVARVADEPLVGLDRDRAVRARLLAVLEQRRADALLVAAVVQLAVELVDEVAAVGEDQDAAGARGLDEAHARRPSCRRRSRARTRSGARRPGPRAARASCSASSSSSSASASQSTRLLVLGDLLVALELLLAGGQLLERGLPLPLPFAPLPLAVLGLGEQRDQRARQRVDLVGVERGAVGQVRLVLGEQALEPEHQRVLAAPLDRGLVAAGRRSRRARRRARAGARCPGPARVGVLALVHERLARELLGALEDPRRMTDDCDGAEVLSAMRLWVLKRGERSLTGCRTGHRPAATRPE